MQKKLLSLLMIASCSIVYAEVEETVPVISAEKNARNIERYDATVKRLEELRKQEEALEEELDEIEIERYMYDYRDIHRMGCVNTLSDDNGAMDRCKQTINTYTDEKKKKRRDKDNGISYSFWSGLTDPLPDSRSAKTYARFDNLAQQSARINSSLFAEHEKYKKLVETNILPNLVQDLSDKSSAIEKVYIKAFQRCDCFGGSEYYNCLSRLGVSQAVASEKFVEGFVGEAFVNAYQKARERNIPITQEEMILIAEKNTVTKDSVAKMYVAQEELKKLIRRESSNPGTGDTLEQKPHIDLTGEKKEKLAIDDKSEDKDDITKNQDDQGALSQ